LEESISCHVPGGKTIGQAVDKFLNSLRRHEKDFGRRDGNRMIRTRNPEFLAVAQVHGEPNKEKEEIQPLARLTS